MKLLILLVFFLELLFMVYQEKFQKIKIIKNIDCLGVLLWWTSSQFSSKFSNIFDESNDHTSANQRTVLIK